METEQVIIYLSSAGESVFASFIGVCIFLSEGPDMQKGDLSISSGTLKQSFKEFKSAPRGVEFSGI